MKYEILPTGRFKKDLKVIMKRGYNIQLLQDIISVGGWNSIARKKQGSYAGR